MTKDWQELQQLIDDARYSATGEVVIARNYTIDAPLIIRDTNQVCVTLRGYATMWDTGRRSVITATFKDHPILSIQRGKGCIISGINFQGAGSDGIDTRTNVYAAIAIDPFNDGNKSGSTGIFIDHCTFNKVVAGVANSIDIEIRATSTQVLFYINGVLKATHTTNITENLARLFCFGVGLKKKIGTGERYMEVDKLLFKIDE